MSSLLGVPGEATHSKCPVLISVAQGLPQGLETPNKCHRQRFGPNDLHKNPPKTNYRIFPTDTRSNDNFNFHVHACTCVYARARVYVCGSVKAEGRPLQLSKKKKKKKIPLGPLLGRGHGCLRIPSRVCSLDQRKGKQKWKKMIAAPQENTWKWGAAFWTSPMAGSGWLGMW